MRLMWAAPMKSNVVGKRGLMDQRLSNGVVNGEHGAGASTERDKKFSEATEDGNSGVRGLIQVHESLHISQQQSQGPAIHWERFLPVRSIKVLLVEDDDSTRHVVSALLRNCSYEVTAVSNGLQAWKTLEDPSSHIDLILTEVAMPLLSGIDLLCKIMSHKTLMNIPVIMMSSHDSMGIVFKCLSKGAVDFLVKPIRRNELKNLWQHVWRRCHSSSGSGSESGTHTRKSVKSRSNGASGNNSDSSDENDFGSKGLTVRDGSDNGSGTQSSWTKCPTDIGSPHTVSPLNLVVDAPDSTCAQVMHTKPEKVSIRWVRATAKDCHEQSDQLDDVAMGKDLGRGLSLNMQLEHQPEELSAHLTGKSITKLSDVDGKQLNKGHSNVREKGKPAYNGDKTKTTKDQAKNVVDVATDSNSPQAESRDLNTPNGFSVISQTKASSCSKQLPSLELSLKRLGGEGEGMKAAGDERNVLRHSYLSAFSKYTTASSANQVQTANVGNCSPLDNNSAAMNTETTNNFPSHSNDTPPNQHSNGSNNFNDMGSSNIYLGTKPEAFDMKPESVTGIGSFNSSFLQTVQNNNASSPQQKISAKTDNSEMVKARVGVSEQGFQADDNHCQLHHCDRGITHNAAVDLQSDYGDLLPKKLKEAAQQCVSSNDFGGPVESNAGNYSLDGNAAESDDGSNGQNGSSTNLTTGVMNAESGNGVAGSTGVGGSDSKNSGNIVDEGRIALREKALTKFRQKRKERCFEKRVRYHSRQKLAEQRPRIRGQFVRRTVSDTREEKDTQSNNLVSLDNSLGAPQ